MTISDFVDMGLDVATADTGAGRVLAVTGALAFGAAAVGALLRIPIDQDEWSDLNEDSYYGFRPYIHTEWPPIYMPSDADCMLVQSDDAEEVVRLLRKGSRAPNHDMGRYGWTGWDALGDRVERAASEAGG